MIFITVCVVMLWKCNTDDYECVISYDERERERVRERGRVIQQSARYYVARTIQPLAWRL